MDTQTQRIICCVLCAPCWFGYFGFLHNTCRAFDICLKVFEGIGSTLWKVLYLVFMWCCGFSIVNCVLCCVGCLHCIGQPFENYKSASTWVDAFHARVYEKSCEFEGKIAEVLNKMFKH
ncbi:hypothetical protein pb186bvf_013416 [Paramecium bursaria]